MKWYEKIVVEPTGFDENSFERYEVYMYDTRNGDIIVHYGYFYTYESAKSCKDIITKLPKEFIFRNREGNVQ